MELEKDVNVGGKSIGKIGFDMDCDGTRDYIKKMYQKSKIDQVLDFYGIPHIYKDEYKRYLKYRIQPRHYDIVNNHFLKVLELEGYDITDFDYGTIQEDYNHKVPEAEQTGLDLHIDYQDFLQRDLKHRETLKMESETVVNEQMLGMQQMMMGMMEEMKQLKSMIGNPNVLLSKQDKNEGGKTLSGSDSTTNATGTKGPNDSGFGNGNPTADTGTTSEEITSNETEKTGGIIEESELTGIDESKGSGEVKGIDNGDQGSKLIGDLSDSGDSGEGTTDTSGTSGEETIQSGKKDRRTM